MPLYIKYYSNCKIIFNLHFKFSSFTDSRFLNCEFHQFMPITNLDARTITFFCPRFESPSVYMIQDLIIEARLLIIKPDGNVPDTDKKVAPINNVGHSMWSSVRLILNEKDISASPGLYPYKAYVSNTLSYDTFVKSNQLSVQGYVCDLSSHMDVEDNSGFAARNALFREDFNENNPYRSDGACFITRLHHDLVNIESGLPPSKFVSF